MVEMDSHFHEIKGAELEDHFLRGVTTPRTEDFQAVFS